MKGATNANGRVTVGPPRAVKSWSARVSGALSAGLGTVAGITPHVLHHIGPLAGAAILAGTLGSVLFGVIGFALTVPLLIRLKRRFGSWAAPGVALALFVVMFTISTLWIGPWIRGEDGRDDAPADPHHPAESALVPGYTGTLPPVGRSTWVSSTARTTIEATRMLRAKGLAKPVCLGTHAIIAEGAEEELRQEGAASVITCNTVPHATHGIDVAPALAKTVRTLLEGSMLS
jgi:hypothetical protein